MSKTQAVQAEMIKAIKQREQQRKDVLSLLLSALKAKAKDKRAPLSPEEEDGVIRREIKSTKETMESAMGGRADIVEQCQYTLSVLEEFAPESMGEEEIQRAIAKVLEELGLLAPTAKDKGVIMKNLMPLVKGKADGALVNQLVGRALGM